MINFSLNDTVNTFCPVNTHEHPVFKMGWTPDEHPSRKHLAYEAGNAEA